jgi:hypothetical protein
MKRTDIAARFLIAGLTLMIPLSGVEADNRESKAAPPSIQEQVEQRPTAPASDDQDGKPIDRSGEVPPQKLTPAVGTPMYKPPLRGAPGGRIAGGTRGTGDEALTLSVLAPDHTALTVQEQPSLYWSLSKPSPYPIELTVIDNQAIHPLLETRLSSPVRAGVQRVRLVDYSVRLTPGVPYQWFVTLVLDPYQRSKDIIAGGTIERIEFPAALRGKLAQAGKAKAPHIYAEAGLWYDALTAISELIDGTPKDTLLRKQRAALLEQVGLPEVARYDVHPRAAN